MSINLNGEDKRLGLALSSGNKDSELGEWFLGQQAAGGFPISSAVAASSAFPPVFPPLKIEQDQYDAGEVEFVTLTDGGVYDNLGVNPLFRSRNQLDYAIISDAGKPFDIDDSPTEKGSVVLKESIAILMEQVRGLQFKRLKLSQLVDNGPKPLWNSINSEKGQAREGDAIFASAIKTNLKKLKSPEIDVLTRHAGVLLQHRLETYVPELIP